MDISLRNAIHQLNPWLTAADCRILDLHHFIQRKQTEVLLLPDWDSLWTILVGPRQAGKTTLGKYLCHEMVQSQRVSQLFYLSCDYLEIRDWLEKGPQFIEKVLAFWKLDKPVLFIDEAQRLSNPGLLLKAIADLHLPMKLIASGSSHLEIKSKIQEHLTGRHLECLVLPLSQSEMIEDDLSLEERLLYGAYPNITRTRQKEILLRQLYSDYISKDIIEILKIGKPDVMEKLVGLMAHCAGQLVNYQQLATDCRVTIPTVQNYLSILEKTYVLCAVRPFVGNKRTEITSNPIYYFIDNGFRNQALKNFSPLESRTDTGLLVENYVFQELLKYKTHRFSDYSIYYWRTKSGAEVDFIIKYGQTIIPIEVKYRTVRTAKITRGFRSFLDAYQPPLSIVITKTFSEKREIEGCEVLFIPLAEMDELFRFIDGALKVTL